MLSTKFVEKQPDYIDRQIEDNFGRLRMVSLAIAIFGLLFLLQTLYMRYSGRAKLVNDYYLLVFTVMFLISLLFKLGSNFLYHKLNLLTLDMILFGYISLMVVLTASVSVFDSFVSEPNIVALTFGVLGFSIVYRAKVPRLILFHSVVIIYYLFLYIFMNNRLIGLLEILPIGVLVVGSVYLSRIREMKEIEIFDLRKKLESSDRHHGDISFRDSLTELYTRPYLEDFVQRQIAHLNRTGHPFTVVLVNLDSSTRINSELGHLAADQMVVEFAQRLRKMTREVDLTSRISNEMFGVVLPDTALKPSLKVADRIYNDLKKNRLPSVPWSINARIGVAEAHPEESVASLLKRVTTLCNEAGSSSNSFIMYSLLDT